MSFVRIGLLSSLLALSGAAQTHSILPRESYRHYVEYFNSVTTPDVESYISDQQAWPWLKENVPFFACPDPDLERTWYYRWWTLRKHLRKTPAGFIFTEFLRPVRHGSDYNAISCAFGHHIADARWLSDPTYLDQYIGFWLRSGENGGLQRHYHQFSNWTAAALYERYQVDGRRDALLAWLDPLLADYALWEADRLLPSGLYWQFDVRDGMEDSISGGRKVKNARPSINSYMYGNAVAMARITRLAGREEISRQFDAKAANLRKLVQDELWNREQSFFETKLESGQSANVREEIGFSPWLFELPEPKRGYEVAWRQLMDPQGFYAPYGPTTAERRHPGFKIAESGDDCQWNGPSWPFSTTLTLKALANVLHDYPQNDISKQDYFETLMIYAASQQLTLPDGRKIAFVDENLNPLTGEWHARARKIKKNTFYGRGDHYNHSAFADLIITGLVGLRPRADNQVEIRPLLPEDKWDWFCLEGVPYHGHRLTIQWDRTGQHFHNGRGLRLFIDGRLRASAKRLSPLSARL